MFVHSLSEHKRVYGGYMKLLVVSGSQRELSQSAKVGQFIAAQSKQFASVNHIELCKFDLPFWDGESETKKETVAGWSYIEKLVRQADALVLITPEWGGMVTPILKNFLLLCDAQDTGHKPALLVSVVSGISGAYPISELRMNSLKNNKIVAVPDHLIVRDVNEVLNPITSQPRLSRRDRNIRDRIDYSIHMLYQYALALFKVREARKNQPFPKQQEYCYGM